MLLFPRSKIGYARQVVGMHSIRHVDYGRWPDQTRQRNLIIGETTLGEMDRGIQVGASVLCGLELVRGIEPATFHSLEGEFFESEADRIRRPVDGRFGERVCEVYPIAAGPIENRGVIGRSDLATCEDSDE